MRQRVPIEREEEVSQCIQEGLTLLGYLVLCTTVRLSAGSGCTPGVPDLLVTHSRWPPGVWLGIEVKGTRTRLSPEQQVLSSLARIKVCRSWEEALEAVHKVEVGLLRCENSS